MYADADGLRCAALLRARASHHLGRAFARALSFPRNGLAAFIAQGRLGQWDHAERHRTDDS